MVGTALSFTFFTGILWLLGHSTPCHATMIQNTVTHLMSLFEVNHLMSSFISLV
jgi:hypothetical protein